jgi:hypothetical protein
MNEELKEVAEHLPDAPIGKAEGIAAIALSMAMRYHDITTVQDGTLYQQYKLEGKNLPPLHIDMVFETAIQIERHLLRSNDRIAAIVMEALEEVIIEREPETYDPDEEAPSA